MHGTDFQHEHDEHSRGPGAAFRVGIGGPVGTVAASVMEIRSPERLPHAATLFSEIDPELQLTIEPRLFGS